MSLNWLSLSFTIICVPVQLPYGPTVSLYSYRMASKFTVHFPLLVGAYWRSHVLSIQLLYGTGTGPYGSCMVPMWHRTVAVWYGHGTVRRFYRFMMTKYAPVPDFKIVCTWTQMIVKDLLDQSRLIQLLWRRCGLYMLLSWWCPFKMRKGKWRPDSLKLSINWKVPYHFWPLLAVVGQYL